MCLKKFDCNSLPSDPALHLLQEFWLFRVTRASGWFTVLQSFQRQTSTKVGWASVVTCLLVTLTKQALIDCLM